MANEELSKIVQRAMADAGLTITQAADRMGMNYVTVWKMAHGRSVSAATVLRFAEATGADASELMRVAHPELSAMSGGADFAQGMKDASGAYTPLPSTSRLPAGWDPPLLSLRRADGWQVQPPHRRSRPAC